MKRRVVCRTDRLKQAASYKTRDKHYKDELVKHGKQHRCLNLCKTSKGNYVRPRKGNSYCGKCKQQKKDLANGANAPSSLSSTDAGAASSSSTPADEVRSATIIDVGSDSMSDGSESERSNSPVPLELLFSDSDASSNDDAFADI